MTHYQSEIIRIRNICYSNKAQIETVIGARHYINNNFDRELNLNLLSFAAAIQKILWTDS
jgi:hypothetical protein